jgi:hypothetical protein
VGWLDRLEKVATGFGGALQAPLGLVKDFSTAWKKDDPEFDGFWNVLIGRSAARGGQVTNNLFGPDEGFGAAIGGLPEKQVRQPVNKLFDGLEWTYREGFSEPYTALLGAAQSGDLSPSSMREQRQYVQDQGVSPGEAIGAIGLNRSIDDPDEIESVPGLLSGSIDAALRIVADPTVIGAKAAGAARTALVVKPVKPGSDDFDKIMGSNRLAKVKEEMSGKSAAEIRDRFFPNTPKGDALSSALADVDDVGKDRILRLAMGDRSQLARLWEERADIAGRIERLEGTQDDLLASLDPENFTKVNGLREKTKPPANLSREEDDAFVGGLAALDDELTRTNRELDVLYRDEADTFRTQTIMGALRAQPRAGVAGAVRHDITRSSFYQQSLYAAPLRKVFNVRPERMIRVDEPDGDFNVQRYLKKTGWAQEHQDEWRSRYMQQMDAESRSRVLVQMEDAALETMAKNAGITPDELAEIMQEVTRGRQQASTVLGGRVFDGEGRSKVTFKDDAANLTTELPLMVPQTANLVPLADLDQVRRALTRIGEIRRNNPAARVPGELLEGLYRAWKPAMLLRVGWTVRSVTDAQLRIAAKVGVASQLRHITPGLSNTIGNAQKRRLASIASGGSREQRRQAAAEIAEDRIGFGTMNVHGYQVEKAFGLDPANPVPERAMASSAAAFNRIIGQEERLIDEKLRAATGKWGSLDPVKDAKDYDKSWLRDVNDQLGRDLIARQFLEGKSFDQVLAWTRTPDGRRHMARLPHERRRNPRNTVGAIQEQVESYTLGSAAIKRAALDRKATISLLDEATEGATEARPIIHGELLADVRGQSATGQVLNNFITEAYRMMGTLPEDTLARHPFFDALYTDEATRLIGVLDGQARRAGQRLSMEEIRLAQDQARKYALNQVRRTLYDFAEQSDFAHMLKFLSPFYVAWQEAWTKWAGLAVENPAFIARGRMLWQSPERAGLVVDENGNEVGLDQDTGDTIRYEDGTTAVIGKERFVRIPLPKGVSKIVGLKGVEGQGELLLSKRSANFILEASPGFGPVLTVPAQEIVRERPQLEESLRFILPYGVGEGVVDALLPSTARRAVAAAQGEEDRVFRNTAMRILTDSVTDVRLGKRDRPLTWQEALERTKQLYNVRAVAAWVMPAAIGFKSPYRPYLDKYRRLRAEDPQNAEARFLDEEGEEFFALTQSFTRSNDGVPPTAEAYAARGEYRDLIEQHPQIGRLIVGEEAAAGAYVSSIYRAQLETKVSPTSNLAQREAMSVEQVVDGPNVRQGWIEFRRAMDYIEAARVERELPNLRVKAAEDLAEIKRQAIDRLREKFPEWYDDFAIVDRNAQAKRLAGLRAVAADERLAARPDIAGLRFYLQIRDYFTALLAWRDGQGGSAQLDAAANVDVADAWETVKGAMAERNPAFAAVLYRYLDRDDLSAA